MIKIFFGPKWLNSYLCLYDLSPFDLGSTRLITGNDTSDVEQRRDYKPFGNTQTSSGNNESAYQFTQKELVSKTELYYFGARYYDPSIGRFISVDPLAEENAGWSPYSYSKNNPLNRIDPDGRNDLLAQLATYFSAESHKTANDYNNFASSRIVIPQAAIDQSGAETFADAVQFLNDSAEQGRLNTAEGLDKISDISGKASAACYTGALLAAPVPPVSTALAFSGSVLGGTSTATGAMKALLTWDENDGTTATIGIAGYLVGNTSVNSVRRIIDSSDNFINYLISSGIQGPIQYITIGADNLIDEQEIDEHE